MQCVNKVICFVVSSIIQMVNVTIKYIELFSIFPFNFIAFVKDVIE